MTAAHPPAAEAQAQAQADTLGEETLAFIEYRAALALLERGSFAEAAVLLERLVARFPKEITLRRNLAAALYRSGQGSRARTELRRLQELDPARGGQYRALSARIAAERPLRFQLEGRATGSTNINGATANRTIDTIFGPLTVDEPRKSGLGFELTGTVAARLKAERDHHLSARLSLGAVVYTDPDLNRLSLRAALRDVRRLEDITLTVEPSVTRALFEDTADNFTRTQLSWTAGIPLTTGVQSQLGADIAHTWYDDRRADDQAGGLTLRLRGATTWQVSPTLGLSGTWSLNRAAPAFAHFRSRGWELGTSATLKLGEAWRVSAGIFGGETAYAADFPGLGAPRQDRHLGISLGVQTDHIRVLGQVPRLTCRARRSNSNVPIYDDRNLVECGVRLSQAF